LPRTNVLYQLWCNFDAKNAKMNLPKLAYLHFQKTLELPFSLDYRNDSFIA
jgi:hypothetical protein